MEGEQVNADQAARSAKSMYDEALSSAVLAAVIDPTMVIGEDGVIIYFNPAACKAFGTTAEVAIGSNVSFLMADKDHSTNHNEYLQNYKKTGQKKMIGRNRTVTAKRCDDGSTWQASLSISEVTLDCKRYFVGTLRDVTGAMEREKLFSSVIDEAIDGIFTINEMGIITLVNRSALTMFGYSEEELVGKNINILMPEPHRSQHDQYIQNYMKTGIEKMIGTDRTVTVKRKDNKEFRCRLGLSKINENSLGNGTNSATFVGLLHDLTHELAAREADARAELADRMRRQKALFLASMSHEIRTPLNGIFGMLELLRSTQLDEVQTEWLATCSRSAQSLTTILDDILLFSRADGGAITLERLSFNVRDIVEDAVMVVSHANSGNPNPNQNASLVDLVYNVARSVPERMIGDPTRLRQVMLIFLSNALKFTSVGHVALEVSIDGIDDDSDDDEDKPGRRKKKNGESGVKMALKFEVSDTGIGMSKKQIKKLFQPFTQADDSTTRQYGGTGLGLSIAKKLVDLMEGEIVVESRPNRGSTFSFTALVNKDPDSANTVSDLHDTIPEKDLELLRGTHILSIDDNAVNTDYLVNLLKLLGCDVTGARSGVEGVELCKLAALREDPYEILLLDFAMPSMSGLEVAEVTASSETIASTGMRVIMLGSIDVHQAIAACPYIHGFTTKPIRRLPLIRMIVEQLKIKRGILRAPASNRPIALREGDNPVLPASEVVESHFDEETEFNGRMNGNGNGAIRPNRLQILYVEDNLINQKVIVSILSKWKCQVTTAINGIAGFEQRIAHRGKKGKKPFDLILCDLHMPSCDGYQCVEMIRDWEAKNNEDPVPICAVTADANPETKDRCLSDDGGFNEFLAKPLRKFALRDMIAKMCGNDRLYLEEGPAMYVRRLSTNGEPEPEPEGGTHVLVVDDADTMRLLLRTLLVRMGCTVSEASSGEQAVEIVKESFTNGKGEVEIVFCDMQMPPGMGGIETTKEIVRLCGASTLPIIGMTADDVDNATLEVARAAGMVSLISKPLGKSQLAGFLAEYTGMVGGCPSSEAPEKQAKGIVFDKKRALEICGNDKEFLKSLLGDIATDLKSRKEALSLSVQRKDCARVAEIAHNIKGMASLCSFTRLAEAACDCQKSAANSNYMEVRTLCQIVLKEIHAALEEAEGFDENDV